ncbi:rhomboid family intramembrane serine protease [Furfurilactobacillus sp. WILCCON 0119]|uniref:rhomboid family intramembrane serine protease n=1 Tax=Furfurilactobacillus entadae TaxID=2922307 RepID=UPI0035ECBCCB
MRRWRRFVNGSPMTITLVTINVLVFLWMVFRYQLPAVSLNSTFSGQALLEAGARYTPLIQAGQWWRLFTPMFIHMSVMHIGLNMVVLYFLGVQIESLFGHWRMLVIYVVSGFTGNAWSAAFQPHTLSAGASTSIFGLFGAFIILGIIERANPYLRQVARQFGLLVVLNLVFDLFSAGVDIWGHIGGLLGGFVVAMILWVPANHSYRRLPIWWRGLGVIGLGAVSAVLLLIM